YPQHRLKHLHEQSTGDGCIPHAKARTEGGAQAAGDMHPCLQTGSDSYKVIIYKPLTHEREKGYPVGHHYGRLQIRPTEIIAGDVVFVFFFKFSLVVDTQPP